MPKLAERTRRIIGDTLIARRSHFDPIHPAVAECFELFVDRHEAYKKLLDDKEAQKSKHAQARNAQERQRETAANLYSWAYKRLVLTPPPFDDEQQRPSGPYLKSQLFPLGRPAKVLTKPKLVDALHHLNAFLERESYGLPEDYLQALQQQCLALPAAIATVVQDQDRLSILVKQTHEGAATWDRTYLALQDLVRAYLRLQNRLDKMTLLFTN